MSSAQWPQINTKRTEANPVTPGEGQLGSESLIFQPSLPMMVAGGLVFSDHPAQPVFNWLTPPVQQTSSFWDQQDTISAIFAPAVDDPDLDSSITSRMKYFAFHMAPAEWAEQYSPDLTQTESIPLLPANEVEPSHPLPGDPEPESPEEPEATRETAPDLAASSDSSEESLAYNPAEPEFDEPIPFGEVTDLSSDWELTALDEFAGTLPEAEEQLTAEEPAATLIHQEQETAGEESDDEPAILDFTPEFADTGLALDGSGLQEPTPVVEQPSIVWAPATHPATDFTVTTPTRTWEPRDHGLFISVSITEGFSWLSQFHLLTGEVYDDVLST